MIKRKVVSSQYLRRLYITEERSIPDVAKAINVSRSVARRLLLDAGITLRSRADGIRAARAKLGKHLLDKRRSFTPQWKENIATSKRAHSEKHAAGVSHKASGYSEFTRGPDKGRGLHVVTMEKHIGRRLARDEVVHHIDGNPRNNDLNNLQLMTRAAHTSLHRRERAQGESHGKC